MRGSFKDWNIKDIKSARYRDNRGVYQSLDLKALKLPHRQSFAIRSPQRKSFDKY